MISDGAQMGVALMMQISRRSLLRSTAVAVAGGTFVSKYPLSALSPSVNDSSQIQFGVQLNAFPIDPNRFDTFLGTLEIGRAHV